MARLGVRFESARQEWETPAELFGPLNDEFGFTLDAAADAANAKVPGCYFDEAADGLAQNWGSHVVWLNPPYGDKSRSLAAWVKKAAEAAGSGATCVLLIPARTNTNWFHDYCLARGEVRFIRGRPRFGDAEHGLPLPLCVVIFRPPPA
jgi:site-specific DNA-methyltransferase (adenine-specific)